MSVLSAVIVKPTSLLPVHGQKPLHVARHLEARVMAGITHQHGGASAAEVVDDAAARSAARKPVGQWNEIEIVSKDGTLASRLNGMLISTCQPSGLTSGLLGLQSEGYEVQFKHLRVRVDE